MHSGRTLLTHVFDLVNLNVHGPVGAIVVSLDVIQSQQHVGHVTVRLRPPPPPGVSMVVGVVIQLVYVHPPSVLLPELSNDQRFVESKGPKVVLPEVCLLKLYYHEREGNCMGFAGRDKAIYIFF